MIKITCDWCGKELTEDSLMHQRIQSYLDEGTVRCDSCDNAWRQMQSKITERKHKCYQSIVEEEIANYVSKLQVDSK